MGSSDINIVLLYCRLASFLSPCRIFTGTAYIGYLGGRSAASTQGNLTGRWLSQPSLALLLVLALSLLD